MTKKQIVIVRESYLEGRQGMSDKYALLVKFEDDTEFRPYLDEDSAEEFFKIHKNNGYTIMTEDGEIVTSQKQMADLF